MEKPFKRIPPSFETDSRPSTVLPAYTDIDTNNHVNNIKYANYVLNAVHPCEDQRIHEFEIEYHREVRGDAPIRLPILREEGGVLVKGLGEENARMFTARLTWA